MITSLADADVHAPVVDAAIDTAAAMLGMEVVYIGGLIDDVFSVLRMVGDMPGFDVGHVIPRQRSLCHQMVAGAPAVTSNAAAIPEYADTAPVRELGVTSYVGVPIRRHGQVVGTLCGIDRAAVTVPENVVAVLTGLAGVIEAHVADDNESGTVIRRTGNGWRVGMTDGLDLTSAMSLADLLASDVGPPERPPRVDPGELSEVERLRISVGQLEHALAARVVVEQAIGVMSERQRLSPRAAFERLRKAARTRGRKVHDVAQEVVLSAADPGVPLPPELHGSR